MIFKKSEGKSISKRLSAPFVRNTVTYKCDLYASKDADNPVTSSNISFGFDIRLIPLVLATVAALGVAFFALRRTFRK